ncbi:MAG: ATP-binding protein [Lachnospiraceae bacterium]
MINYIKKHLTAKIFATMLVLFCAVSGITYAYIALFAPKSYLAIVDYNVDAAAERLVSRLEHVDIEQYGQLLNNFSKEYSVVLEVQDDAGKTVDYGSKATFSYAPSNQGDSEFTTFTGLTKTYVFRLKDSPQAYTLVMLGNRQPVNLFTLALRQVLPSLLIVIVLLSLAVSYLYSRYITRPVIHLNEVSKKLAGLNFDVYFQQDRADELGELAGSLNTLSRSLADALDELKKTNHILQEDIVREKQLELQQLVFFSAASHELKTPITILKGQLQGMLYGVGGYKDRDKYLNRAFEITCDMEKLVREILTIPKMRASDFNLQLETVDLAEFISDLADEYEELFLNKDLQAERMLANGSFVRIDRKLFTKVISNLLSNAVHYSPDGARILIKAFQAEKEIICTIENAGVHIPDNDIPGLFDAFTRREQSRNRQTGGSGLGLYIVRLVLKLHHFSYRMVNTSEGICFEIRFPHTNNTSTTIIT